MQFPPTPAFRRRRPRRRASSTTCEASAEPFSPASSIASIAPRPRTSPIDRPALLPREHPAAERLAERRRPGDEALFLDHVEHRERRGLRDRIADVRAADTALDGRVHDLGLAEDARERQTHRDRLGDRDQVGLDVEVLDREEAAGAREPGLDLVADEDDAVLVADRAKPLHELARRRDEPTFALHRLEDDRGDVLGGDHRRERAAQARASASSDETPR